MPSSPLFIDRTSGTLDTDQLMREAIPLGRLIGAIGIVALIPFAIGLTIGVFQGALVFVSQFLLAVGTGLVLLYVITRAIQLAGEQDDLTRTVTDESGQ